MNLQDIERVLQAAKGDRSAKCHLPRLRIVMSLAAFTLARLAEVREAAPAYGFNSITERPRQVIA